MKIGIDISQIAYPGFGVATYTQKLVETLLKIDKVNEYILFYSSMRRPLRTDFKGALIKKYRFPPTLLDIIWNKLHILPIETLIGKIDIFHSSNWVQPPVQAKKVTTIHDMLIYKYPENIHPKIISTQKRQLAWVKKECDLIIADSKTTKDDIIEILGIPEEKIRVIYLASGEEFREKQKEEKIEFVKKKYNLIGDYLLTVGSFEPRKNLSRIIKAYGGIKKTYKVSLVITGQFRWGEKIKYQEGIHNLGFVEKNDLPALYAGSKVFIYPSLYEGFGLPVLEAQSCGCPVVTSDKGSLKEITKDTAIVVDPENAGDIQKGIEKILSMDKEALINLKQKGVAHAGLFTWEKTARETLEVYRELTS